MQKINSSFFGILTHENLRKKCGQLFDGMVGPALYSGLN